MDSSCASCAAGELPAWGKAANEVAQTQTLGVQVALPPQPIGCEQGVGIGL